MNALATARIIKRAFSSNGARLILEARAIIKLIEDDGWRQMAIRGSHRQYRHPTKLGRVTVPGKPSDDLHPKTQAEHPPNTDKDSYCKRVRDTTTVKCHDIRSISFT